MHNKKKVVLFLNTLITLATAPIFICAFYIFIRDKYEKEPIRLLIVGLGLGCLTTIPILYVEKFLLNYKNFFELKYYDLYKSYVVAGFSEETIKFLILYFLVYRNKNFNERFDGIVYAVFVSLGFSLVENILFVTNEDLGGVLTGINRGIFSVPAHMLYGVSMGYYFALMKYEDENKINFVLALMYPIFIHGTFDFILTLENKLNYFVFSIYIILMWRQGLKKIKKHIEMSPFKPNSKIKS